MITNLLKAPFFCLLNEKQHCVYTNQRTHPALHCTILHSTALMWACMITATFCGLSPADEPLRARSVHAHGRARAHSHVIVSEIRLDSASAWDRTWVLTCRELPSAIWPWQQLTVSTRELPMFITFLPDNQQQPPLSNLCILPPGEWFHISSTSHIHTDVSLYNF